MEKGTRVKVSDGMPEPPKHHKKKHSLWEMTNFDGYVWRDETTAFGKICVGKTLDSCVVFSVPTRFVTTL